MNGLNKVNNIKKNHYNPIRFYIEQQKYTIRAENKHKLVNM